MSTNVPRFQSIFQFLLHNFVLAKLATSSKRFKYAIVKYQNTVKYFILLIFYFACCNKEGFNFQNHFIEYVTVEVDHLTEIDFSEFYQTVQSSVSPKHASNST